MGGEKEVTEEEALEVLKDNIRIYHRIMGVILPIILAVFPLAVLSETLLLSNSVYIYMGIFFLTFGIAASFKHKADKMMSKCWHSPTIFDPSRELIIRFFIAAIIALLLMNVVIWVLFTHANIEYHIIDFYLSGSLFGQIFFIGSLLVALIIIRRISKKHNEEQKGSSRKVFRMKVSELGDMVIRALNNLHLEFTREKKESTFWTVGHDKILIKDTTLEIWLASYNILSVFIGGITPENRELVEKIQKQIDIHHGLSSMKT